MVIAYPTDTTDAQWQAIVKLIPRAKDGGRLREVNMRSLVNGIFYLVRPGCPWGMLPQGVSAL
jgi:transposase